MKIISIERTINYVRIEGQSLPQTTTTVTYEDGSTANTVSHEGCWGNAQVVNLPDGNFKVGVWQHRQVAPFQWEYRLHSTDWSSVDNLGRIFCLESLSLVYDQPQPAITRNPRYKVVYKGFSHEEYEALKAAAKAELPFHIRIKYAKQKYCYGAISIYPFRERNWTAEQTMQVYEFLLRHNVTGTQKHIFYGEHVAYVYSAGFGYMYKEV